MPTEQQRRRSAVGAVVRIVGQLALFDECGHLLRRETVAGADGDMEAARLRRMVL